MCTIVLLVGLSPFLNIPCTNASVVEGWRLFAVTVHVAEVFLCDLSRAACGKLLRQPAPTQMFDF